MSPNLDEIQQVLNKATGYVLEVSRGIAQWGQDRFRVATQEEKKSLKQGTTLPPPFPHALPTPFAHGFT